MLNKSDQWRSDYKNRSIGNYTKEGMTFGVSAINNCTIDTSNRGIGYLALAERHPVLELILTEGHGVVAGPDGTGIMVGTDGHLTPRGWEFMPAEALTREHLYRRYLDLNKKRIAMTLKGWQDQYRVYLSDDWAGKTVEAHYGTGLLEVLTFTDGTYFISYYDNPDNPPIDAEVAEELVGLGIISQEEMDSWNSSVA